MGTQLHRLLGAGAGLATAVGLLAAPSSASPDDTVTGTLVPLGCISAGYPWAAACGATAPSLTAPFSVAVSNDGASVYVASLNNGSVSQFDRDPATGVLTYVGCVADPDTNPDTTPDDPSFDPRCTSEQDGLFGAWSLALSPDDQAVYVVSNGDFDAFEVVTLARDPGSGVLSPAGCFANVASDAVGCTVVSGLDGANQVTVSPDGRSVYVTSAADGALVTFDRDGETSALTSAGCIADTESSADCDETAPDLAGAASVAVSPDSTSVYVGASGDDAVVGFTRTPDGQLMAAPGLGAGLDSAAGVTLSPDGRSVYVASAEGSTVTWFPRAVDGTLGPGTAYPGLANISSLTASPEGRSVYATLAEWGDDSRVVHFARDPVSGALTPAGCVADAGSALCGTATQEGLEMAYSLALSPDGRHAYAAGSGEGALALFERWVAGPPGPDPDPEPEPEPEPGDDGVDGRVTAERRQHGPRATVRVRAGEPLTVRLRGTVRVSGPTGQRIFTLAPMTFSAPTGVASRSVRLDRKASTKAVRKALRRDRLVIATLRWVLDDGTSQPTRGRLRVRLAE